MFTTRGFVLPWLFAGLLITGTAGCSSSRFSLAKSDKPKPPPKEIDENTEVKYGIPWGKKKTAEEVAAKEPKKSSDELSKDLSDRLALSKNTANRSTKTSELLRTAGEIESRGDLAAAKAAYQKVLDLDSRNGEAHHRLAVIADQMQDTRSADEHYAAALAVNRRDADLLSDLGYSSMLRGRLEDSEKHLKQALEANPYHRGALGHLGAVYAKQGKSEQALTMFRQVGTESEAQQRLAQLMPNSRGTGGPGRLPLTANNSERTAPPMPPDFERRPPNETQLAAMSIDEVRTKMEQERAAAQRKREEEMRREFRPDLSEVEANAANLANNPGGPFRGQPQNAGQPPGNPFAGNPFAGNNAVIPAGQQWPQGQAASNNGLPPNGPMFPQNPMMQAAQSSNTGPAWPQNSGPMNGIGNPMSNGMTNPAIANSMSPNESLMSPQTGGNSSFWQGNLSSVNLQPSQGAPNNPSNTVGGVPTTGLPVGPWTTNPNGPNGMVPNNSGASTNPWGPPTTMQAGYDPQANPNSATTPADANRMAAQMAMGAGPGAMFPGMPAGQPGQQGQQGQQGVRWAYAESLDQNPNLGAVNHATWNNPSSGSAPVQQTNFAPPMSSQGSEGPSTTPIPPWANFNSPAMNMPTPTWPGNTGTLGNNPAAGMPSAPATNPSINPSNGPNGNPFPSGNNAGAGPVVNPGMPSNGFSGNGPGNWPGAPNSAWTNNSANNSNGFAPNSGNPPGNGSSGNGSYGNGGGPVQWPTPSSQSQSSGQWPGTKSGGTSTSGSSSTNNNSSAPTTVPNWPYAPSRP